jgi:hypothetical protein
MNTLETSEDSIMAVWGWCHEIYLQLGYNLAFPANTDRTKTYQWRYLSSIASKFSEWGFDEQTSKQFIRTAVKHCKRAGILHKGLASLHQSNIMRLCYDELSKNSEERSDSIALISTAHAWLEGKSNGDIVRTLLRRSDPDEFCNLTKWFQSSRIPRLYLALSKSCGVALARLSRNNPEEREMLPKTTVLYMLRSEFLKDHLDVSGVKSILGEDWR